MEESDSDDGPPLGPAWDAAIAEAVAPTTGQLALLNKMIKDKRLVGTIKTKSEASRIISKVLGKGKNRRMPGPKSEGPAPRRGGDDDSGPPPPSSGAMSVF